MGGGSGAVIAPHPNPCMFKVTSVTRRQAGTLSPCLT